jgi:tetratricopeptide (TPR) repeat protein
MSNTPRQTRLHELRRAAAMPGDAAARLCDLANALLAEGELDEAIGCYAQAIALRPEMPEAHNNMGVALRRAGKIDEAIAAFGRALDIHLDYADAHNNLGNALCAREDWNAACACFSQAIRLRPDFADAHGNLGNALLGRGLIEPAIACYRRALAIKPDAHGVHNNLSNALCAKGDMAGAMAACRRSLELRPDFAEARLSLSILLLLQGDLENGWREYEWRWKSQEHRTAAAKFPRPMWNGEALGGRRILLHSEQALGDTLQFIRYARLVAQRGGKVIAAVQKELVKLIRSADGVETAVDRNDALPDFDVHCPLLSLPRVFGTTLQDVPADVPYLHADKEKWAARMPADGRMKVGLAWAGGKHPPGRSIELKELAALLENPRIWLCSLQKGDAARQLAGARMPMADWTDELHDFSDTAALVSNLDLVISVDTAVAHLAGGLGKRTWVLLKFVPDWRWMLGGDRSPWYPNMRLFRQARDGDWSRPIRQLAEALHERFAGTATGGAASPGGQAG